LVMIDAIIVDLEKTKCSSKSLIALGQKMKHSARSERMTTYATLREFCVNQLCIVLHCTANWATDAPVTL
jgi:hypothetical protein